MIRVVQWTTGKTGRAAVRAMVTHPMLEIVGCYAYSPGKVGRDVGELCGLGPIGIAATDDVAALISLHPDCITYMPFRPDIDHLVAILESGINIVTTMYMLAGIGCGKDASTRIEDAARLGGSTLYASGLYPGHAPMVALAASAMCSRIDRISVLESVDLRPYASETMFRAMGIDLEPDDPEAPLRVEGACGSFRDQIRVMAQALAVDLDEVGFEAQFATANTTTDFGFMTVRGGRIAGFKGVVSGLRRGHSIIECQFVWKLGENLTPNWPVTMGYVIEIDGYPSLRCTLEPIDSDGATATAMPVVNAIPDVCAAAPGILNRGHLPFVRGAYAFGE
jgi:2,4-diaminopentanoate dehydrogenase